MVFLAAVGCAFAAYVAALLLLRRRGGALAAACALAFAIQLVPLAGPLLLSQDAYAYWDYGRLATRHDANPYAWRRRASRPIRDASDGARVADDEERIRPGVHRGLGRAREGERTLGRGRRLRLPPRGRGRMLALVAVAALARRSRRSASPSSAGTRSSRSTSRAAVTTTSG